MFVIADLQSTFKTLHSAGTSPVYLQTKFHVPSSIASLVVANKLRQISHVGHVVILRVKKKILPRQTPHTVPRPNRHNTLAP